MTDEEIKTNYRSNNSRRWIGFSLLFAGGVLLAERSGIPLPFKIIFNWQIFLIILGIASGISHRFRGGGWLIMILIGSFFYIDDYYPSIHIHEYLWPILLIAIGLIFVLRPRKNKYRYFKDPEYWKEKKQDWKEQYKDDSSLSDDYIDITCVFGGTRKNIVSKNFKGGEAVSFMGGSEINFSQADINGRVVLELTQVFGGTKLIVPPHWDVRTELVSVFGGVEDKRSLDANAVDPSKILVLKGVSVFGGIDIRSY